MTQQKITLINNDCLLVLKSIDDNIIDAIVTDPPYELGFMGKKWDSTGIAYNVDLWCECLRVLKPGGHLLAFGGTRTYHRMTVAIEDAGFEVRDMLEWIYASGFPKSLNAGKNGGPEGFGTALKPAHEPIVMARKPLSEKTIVENVLKHGTGAIDIDGCRIPTNELQKEWSGNSASGTGRYNWNTTGEKREYQGGSHEQGRFPANIIVTDDALNDGVMTKSGKPGGIRGKDSSGFTSHEGTERTGFGDCGSKSRYFDIDVWSEKHGLLQYPKASKRERNAGCEGLEEIEYKRTMSGGADTRGRPTPINKNHHPTVKPVHLMLWLIRLISKEGDTVLDPFMGSGTTGVAAKRLDRNFIGIELDSDYLKIAEARINETKP